MEGRIIKCISNDYTVASEGKDYICKSRGKFRKLKLTPLVGDYVIFDSENHYILDILPRKNELLRPPISNIDQAFVVTSLKEPDYSSYLLDKLLVILSYHSIKPIICFTKSDLLKENELKEIEKVKAYYEKVGYEVYFNTDLDLLKPLFQDKITVFTGQSGAGKSTLLNRLDASLNLKTDAISMALGRGKHTTRHVELIPTLGGYIADTPGFSSISFNEMKESDIRDQFPEFQKNRHLCEYQDCMHVTEPICKIKELLNHSEIMESRYLSYKKFIGR